MLVRSIVLLLTLSTLAACTTTKQAMLSDFEAVEDPQRTPVWCWAACASMIHKYNGQEISQEEIAKRIHGHDEGGELKVAAASRYEVYKALSPDSTEFSFEEIWDAIGDQIEEETAAALEAHEETGETPSGVELRTDPMVAVHAGLDRYFPVRSAPLAALKAEQPAVVGLEGEVEGAQGHLCVIVGAAWKEATETMNSIKELGSKVNLDGVTAKGLDEFEEVWEEHSAVALEASSRILVDTGGLTWVEIVDPWLEDDDATPDVNEMRVRIPARDFVSRVAFVATVEDARTILSRWSDLARIHIESEAKQ